MGNRERVERGTDEHGEKNEKLEENRELETKLLVGRGV